ncbi:MAG: hypothetical protein QW228_02300 [Candidatus Aenigmatarchaeota archaeon]
MKFFGSRSKSFERKGISKEYVEFLLQEQRLKEPTNWYEKLCKFAEKLKVKPSKSMEENLNFQILFSSLNVSPTGVISATILVLLLSFLLVSPILLFTTDFLTTIFFLFIPIGLAWYIFTYPSFMATVNKVQAGDEAIKIILYMVIYLKLNPSLEGAVNFAVQHSKGPITEDIKKAMWDLQIGKYKTVEEALGKYTQKWVWWNEDFVRSLSLLYGVLIEPTEKGREDIMRKALNFILESTHAKMKTYVEEITSPLMILHMMGLLLPVIGLVMFPMISIFLHQQVSTPQLIIGYVVILPFMNYFLINRILHKRPGAFMVPDISKHPKLPSEDYFEIKIGRTRLWIPIFILSLLIGFVVMIPGLLHFADLIINLNFPTPDLNQRLGCSMQISPRKCILMNEAKMTPGNLLATFSITGGFAVMVILYFYLRSFQRIKIRNEIKNIEEEFKLGLFSIGNYLSEGYPIEVGIEKTIEEYEKLGMQKRPTYSFFQKLYYNIKNFGLTFKRALFDKEHGVIKFYPSVLINEIMKILSDASEKSSVLLGTVSKTIASYLESIYTIEARIKELLAETRSALKVQASFIIPMITGIVGALAMFILDMLRILAEKLSEIEKMLGITMLPGEGAKSFIDLLVGGFENIVPLTALQAAIGIYTVEAVSLFSLLLSGIENGFDKTARDWEISQNLITAIVLYGLVNFLALIVFLNLGKTIAQT